MKIRKMAFAGSFYPNSAKELDEYINYFNQSLSDQMKPMSAQAMIAPHAGYEYSGFTANTAYRLLDKKPRRVIVIGPSHRAYIKGASISLFETYETPYGNLDIDHEYARLLKEQFEFLGFSPSVHAEHSTETQMPFIKHYLKEASVIEVIYGDIEVEALSSLIKRLLSDEDNFLVISTDLSHFYSLEEANALDSICLEAIAKKDMKRFDEGCEACGMQGVKALSKVALEKDLAVELLHYCTSYDRNGDQSRVVGYTSALIGV